MKMKFVFVLMLTGLLGLVAGKSVDEQLLKRVIDRLQVDVAKEKRNQEAPETRDESQIQDIGKRYLYAARWDKKDQTVFLHPQRTNKCFEKGVCIFQLKITDIDDNDLVEFSELKCKSEEKSCAMAIPIDEILNPPLGNDKDDGKDFKIGDSGNEIKPDVEKIVCHMCRLVNRAKDLWSCNKKTLDLTKETDLNIWGN